MSNDELKALGLRVKPLVWRRVNESCWGYGNLTVWENRIGDFSAYENGILRHFDSLEEAQKLVAQTYEAETLSRLEKA